jgi:hypothetical protein
VRVYCVPDVCGPEGRNRRGSVVVPANGEVRAILDLSH